MAAVRSIMSHPQADSYWEKTAVSLDAFPALEGTVDADVVVVGAGFTGLSTALHLAQGGAAVRVLEAHQPGWGASGRNGGQVNPTLKYDPQELARMFGVKAELLIETIARSADVVFDLVREHAIDCWPVRGGWLQASYDDAGVPALHRRARQWADRGDAVEPLDAAAMRLRTGTPVFRGGWIDKRAGSVQPLSYVRGLAAAAAAAGARIQGDTPVTGLWRDGRQWVVTAANGAMVRASQVVLATNGYSDSLWPGLAQSILSANSFIVATAALGEKSAHILPAGETFSTAQRLLIYMRKEKDGRILLGGRGLFPDPSSPADFAHIERSLAMLYPELAPFSLEYRWAGRIAITRDFMPHVHQPAPGLTVALGYNGRGVAAATVMGRHLAKWLAGSPEADFPFPVTRIARIPLHGTLQRFYISAGVAWYGLLDRLSR